MNRALPLLAALALAACSAPPDPAGSADDGPIATATQAIASAHTGDPCATAADCIPTDKPCGSTVCAASVCAVVAIPAGSPCSSGVGVCDAKCTCVLPEAHCKTPRLPAPTPCDASSECPSDLCTVGVCTAAGWCAWAPLADGVVCGPDLACAEGLCCAQ